MSSYTLSDDEAVLLDGQCSEKNQALVDAAKARLAAAVTYADVAPHIAALIADVLGAAHSNGALSWSRERIRFCSYCKTRPDPAYVLYKSGPRKGQPNWSKPRYLAGVEFARRFVHIRHHVSVGGCAECVKAAEPYLIEVLATVEAEVPERLRHPDAPKRHKSPNKKCPKCDWEGHERQMTRERTVMGDGWYYAGCPECGAKNQFLSSEGPKTVDGFVIVTEPPGVEE